MRIDQVQGSERWFEAPACQAIKINLTGAGTVLGEDLYPQVLGKVIIE